jgi:hypothetical protein
MTTVGVQKLLPAPENVIWNEGVSGGGLGTHVPSSQTPSTQSVSMQQAPAGRQTGVPSPAVQHRSVSWQQASPQTAPGRQQYWPFSTQTPLQQPSTEQY